MTSGDVQGGCLCGSIRYRITGVPLAQSLCYCRSCRLAAGAPSVAYVVVRRTDFEFIEGDPARFHSSPPVVRTFCGKCGTSLTYQHAEDGDTIDVTTATLDRPEAFPPTREVWLEHKIAWEPSNAELPHFRRSSSEGSDDRT